jgi:hypothetical protein
MNKTLGFLALSIENTEQSKFVLETIDRLSKAAPFMDHILFNTYYFTHMSPFNNFATLHINEAKYFKGPIVCFTLKDMVFLTECISKQKIFLTNTDEWSTAIQAPRNNYQNDRLSQYKELYNLYVESNDLLCTTCSELHPLLDICWKKSLLLSNVESIYEYIKL